MGIVTGILNRHQNYYLLYGLWLVILERLKLFY